MENKNKGLVVGMSVFSAIFFIIGFSTTFIITLGAKVKEIFELNEFKAALLSSAFFITYAIISIPIGLYIKRIGYKRALIFGLLLMAIGSFMFYPAASAPSFALFLIATFVLASGVVFLQTAGNPYVAAIGPEKTASGRLNLAQALNSIATWSAPLLISIFVLKGTSEMLSAVERAESVKMPFVIMGIMILLVVVAISLIKLPELDNSEVKGKSVWGRPHVILGAIGIFCYVGAEAGNGNLIINYLSQPENGGLAPEVAAKFAAIYWGGSMIGRFFAAIMLSDLKNVAKKYMFSGIVLVLALVVAFITFEQNLNQALLFMGFALANFILMQLGRGKTGATLTIFGLVAASLAILTAITTGQVALWTVVAIGLFNSVMFPNIFTLAVKSLDEAELSTASGIISTLIVGGAVIPPIMGYIADNIAYTWAFIVPAICYLYIAWYAFSGNKIRRV